MTLTTILQYIKKKLENINFPFTKGKQLIQTVNQRSTNKGNLNRQVVEEALVEEYASKLLNQLKKELEEVFEQERKSMIEAMRHKIPHTVPHHLKKMNDLEQNISKVDSEIALLDKRYSDCIDQIKLDLTLVPYQNK